MYFSSVSSKITLGGYKFITKIIVCYINQCIFATISSLHGKINLGALHIYAALNTTTYQVGIPIALLKCSHSSLCLSLFSFLFVPIFVSS